jgi:RNA polymerase sigma-70 factor (ECF subfamily)
VDPSRAREDAETVAGFLRGDLEAIAAVDRWIAGAASPFRRRLGDDWHDLLQEARIEILRLLRRSSWRGEARLKTYVWQVVGHTCLDAMRRQKRRPALEPVDDDAPLPSAEPSPLDRVLSDDARRRLLTALEAVPADCRELWRMILSGLSYQQISTQTGVAEGALRVRAHRCRKRAAEALTGNAPPLRAAEG